MKCTNCSHEQASGKFCGKCGTQLQVAEVDVVEDTAVSQPEIETAATVESATSTQSATIEQPATTPAPPVQPAQPNEQVKLVKETSKKYIEYVKEFAVNPSRIFTNPEKQFTNALITMAIVLLLASYTIYTAVKGFIVSVISSVAGGVVGSLFREGFEEGLGDSIGGGIGNIFGSQVPKLSLFPTFGNAFMALVLLVGLSVVISWAVLKISKQPLNFKQLIGIYGTFLIPVVGVIILSFLLIVMNKIALGVGLLILGFLLAVYLYPLRIVLRNFGGALKIDAVHRGLMYFGGFSIVLYVITSLYISSKLGPLKDIIGGLLEELLYY